MRQILDHRRTVRHANAHLLRRITGWLSWLGGSTLAVDKGVARDTDTLTYTLVLRNDGWEAMPSAFFSATFPADLAPIPESAGGGAIWDPAQSAFVWSAPLEVGQSLTFTYQADIVDSLPLGHVVSHTVWMGYDNHFIRFDRGVTTLVNVPVLSQSTFNVTPTVGREGTLLTYLLRVRNTGVADSLVTASNPLPGVLDVVTGTLLSSGGNAQTHDRVITWTVPVAVGEAVTLTYDAVITGIPPGKCMALAHAADGIRVNCVCPAYIETDINREHLARLRASGEIAALEAAHPLGLRGRPEDVAAAVAYLASDETHWNTGCCLPVDGGVSATL